MPLTRLADKFAYCIPHVPVLSLSSTAITRPRELAYNRRNLAQWEMHFKQIAKRIALSRGVVQLMERLAAPHFPIFILHRFANPNTNTRSCLYDAHSIEALRGNLDYLRQLSFEMLGLDALVKRITQGEVISRRSIAFTVDDGYADFHDYALPVFVEFECPVTVFLTTGPTDGECWLWWDKLEFAFRTTTRTSFDIIVENAIWRGSWTSFSERQIAFERLSEQLKRVSADVREMAIQDVLRALGVGLPSAPPPEHAAMSWDEVRRCERSGLVQFGPHTVTHPILSTVPDARAAEELTISWRRLEQECDAPVPIFAYPNGTPDAYGLREIETLERMHMRGAVTTEARYISRHDFRDPRFPLARFAIPRIPYADDHDDFRQAVHGIEYVKWRVRGRPSQGHFGAWRIGRAALQLPACD